MITPRRAWRICDRRARLLCFFQLGLAGMNVWAAWLSGPFWPINLTVAALCLGFAWYHLILGYRAAQLRWWNQVYERKENAPWN